MHDLNYALHINAKDIPKAPVRPMKRPVMTHISAAPAVEPWYHGEGHKMNGVEIWTRDNLVFLFNDGSVKVEPNDVAAHEYAVMDHDIRDGNAGRRAIPSRRGCFCFIEPSDVPGEELFDVIAVYNDKEREPRGKAWQRMKSMISRKHPGIYRTEFKPGRLE